MKLLRLLLILICLAAIPLRAQLSPAWIARYNNGITNGTNQAVKMVLDSAGNIYITGFSQNASSNLGYVTIKYAPNGTQLWTTRYDSPSFPSATPVGIALDSSNNVIVTGSAVTLKYDANGNLLWLQPYSATALGIDGSNNIYITGVNGAFQTMKFSPSGSNLWSVSQPSMYSGSQNVALGLVVTPSGNVGVAGDEIVEPSPPVTTVSLTVANYNSSGTLLWRDFLWTNYNAFGLYVGVGGMAFDTQSNLYLEASYQLAYLTFKFTNSGKVSWIARPGSGNVNNLGAGLLLNSSNVFLEGQAFHSSAANGCGTFALDTNGSLVWSNLYPVAYSGVGAGLALALDSANNVYAAGFVQNSASNNDILTIKYGPNGNQLWVQTYNGLGNGNDQGNAIAVDQAGNVYVTGYEALSGGGTGIVTIKYPPVTLQRQASGGILLQAQGAPGENFDVQASTNLHTWQDLGLSPADSNGLFQFDDTNASLYSSRFYIATPQ